MDETTVIEICRNAIITLLLVAGPSLLIMMIVGTTISVFQTISQINEQTLAMVPKLLVVFATSILLMPFMLGEMRNYFEREIVDRIVGMGNAEGPDLTDIIGSRGAGDKAPSGPAAVPRGGSRR